MLPYHSTGEDPWLRLRRLRGRPPVLVPADSGHAFSAALEQAEEYHRAALAASPSVSPTLLYYSLMQFGKAMHFASGATYRTTPKKHGLGGPPHEHAEDPPITHPRAMRNAKGEHPDPVPEREPIEQRIYDRRIRGYAERGSTFDHVQELLGEDRADFNAPLSDILGGHPDCADLFIDLRDKRPIAFKRVTNDALHSPSLYTQSHLLLEITYGPDELDDEEFAERLEGFPFPAGWEPIPESGYIRAGQRSYVRYIHWVRNPKQADEQGFVDYTHLPFNIDALSWVAPAGRGKDVDGSLVVSPLAPTGKRWSWLTWWWVLLHALGDAARYEPGDWAEAIDMNSPIGADLREVLDRAGRLLPELGYWAIKRGQESQSIPPLEHSSL